MTTTYTCNVIDAVFASRSETVLDREAFNRALADRFLELGEIGVWSFSNEGEGGTAKTTTVVGFYATMNTSMTGNRKDTAIEAFWTIETLYTTQCCNCGCGESCDTCGCCCETCGECGECKCCCEHAA